jgi:LysM repeat protein
VPERFGSSSPLTVVLALIAGLAVGSHPSFTPLAWARALFARGAETTSASPPVAPPASTTAGDPGRAPAHTPELDALRRAEQALFPDVFAPGTVTPASLITGALPPLNDFSDLELPDIPVPRAPAVGTYVRYFTQNTAGRELMGRWLERRNRHRTTVERALEAASLPRALEAVVIAESGYHPRAVSTAGAVGLWQLMPDTARAYGLRVESSYDERRDPVRASESAVKHLAFLRDKLSSWELVFAAYNAGLRRVEDCLRAAAAADYWTLAERPDVLPLETRLYVPKVLALSLVLENLDTFGFGTPAPVAGGAAPVQTPFLPRPLATTPARTQFGVLSELDPDPALTLNAALLPRDSRAIVVVPTGAVAGIGPGGPAWNDAEPVADALGLDWQLEQDAPISALAVSANESYERTYRVMPGDTLSRIATKFGLLPRELAEINDIDNLALVRIGQTLRIPGAGAATSGTESRGTATVYFASPGDTVSKIARSFGISERQVILDNDLKDPGYVREGQILRLLVPRAQARSYLER